MKILLTFRSIHAFILTINVKLEKHRSLRASHGWDLVGFHNKGSFMRFLKQNWSKILWSTLQVDITYILVLFSFSFSYLNVFWYPMQSFFLCFLFICFLSLHWPFLTFFFFLFYSTKFLPDFKHFFISFQEHVLNFLIFLFQQNWAVFALKKKIQINQFCWIF